MFLCLFQKQKLEMQAAPNQRATRQAESPPVSSPLLWCAASRPEGLPGPGKSQNPSLPSSNPWRVLLWNCFQFYLQNQSGPKESNQEVLAIRTLTRKELTLNLFPPKRFLEPVQIYTPSSTTEGLLRTVASSRYKRS